MYKNKVVLITGASSGLGKNLAINYALQKAKIVNISRNEDKAMKIIHKLNEISEYKTLHLNYNIDISNYEAVKNVKDSLVKQNLMPDIIINNAAGNFLCPFENLTENGFKRIIDIVLNGSFNIYHIFGKEMIKNKKSCTFLNISTTYAENSSALVIPSACAKAGVDNLMKGLCVEWSQYNLRFVGIAPGPIENSGGADKLDPFGIFKWYNNYVNPSGRMCHPDEISNLAMYLTSEKGSYINGEIIKIDGGEYIKNSGEFNFITNIPFYNKLLQKK